MALRKALRDCKVFVLAITLSALTACGGGGGDQEDSDQITQNEEFTGSDEPDPNTIETDSDGNEDISTDDTEIPSEETSDPETETEQETGSRGEADTEQSNSGEDQVTLGTPLANGATAQLVALNGIGVNGVENGNAVNIEDLLINSGGAIAFNSMIVTPEIQIPFAREHLIAGPINSPTVLLGPSTSVDGMPPGYEFNFSRTADVASDGTAAVIAAINFAGVDTGLNVNSPLNSLIVADASGAESLITTTDMVTSQRGEVQLTTLDRVVISGRTDVAFLGRTNGAGSALGLYIRNGDSFLSIVEDRNGSTELAPTIDGCQIMLSSNTNQTLVMLDSGALVFNATIDGGNINSPCAQDQEAVFMYKDSEFTVLAREGQSVPNSETFVFDDVVISRVMPDGRVLINSTLVDSTRGFALRDIVFRDSVWLIKSSEVPRLIYVEGESLERSDGAQILNLGNIEEDFNVLLDILVRIGASDQLAMFVNERSFSPSVIRRSLHTAQLRTVQPHDSLETPGASNFSLLDEVFSNETLSGSPLSFTTGSSEIIDGFVETDRYLQIGSFDVDSQGNTYFHARVLDSVSGMQKGDYIFRRSNTGELSVVVTPLDRVRTLERDELILSSVISSGFGFLGDATGASLIVMDDDSLVIYDLNEKSVVQIKF